MNKILDKLRSVRSDTPVKFSFPDGTVTTIPLADVLAALEQSPAFAPPTFPRTVTVTEPLNIRSEAGTTYRIIATLKAGSQVAISSQSGDWLRLADGRGWINVGFVR